MLDSFRELIVYRRNEFFRYFYLFRPVLSFKREYFHLIAGVDKSWVVERHIELLKLIVVKVVHKLREVLARRFVF